jgi:5-methylcytosine-specific restriction endonuclease McrA
MSVNAKPVRALGVGALLVLLESTLPEHGRFISRRSMAKDRKAYRDAYYASHKAEGGRHVVDNLAISCARCNHKKNAKLPSAVGLLPLWSPQEAQQC